MLDFGQFDFGQFDFGRAFGSDSHDLFLIDKGSLQLDSAHRLHTLSVVVRAHLASSVNHPWTFRPECVGVDSGVCSAC